MLGRIARLVLYLVAVVVLAVVGGVSYLFLALPRALVAGEEFSVMSDRSCRSRVA